ncbi:MAG TPA: helix-turn-helix domain-containing protein [Pyrinomonadaceae bacterium]|nr:helix-turn-helix domain-containing protein [Pyrinomonadaceae bacterium]
MNSKTPDQNAEDFGRAGGGESSLGARLRQAREARGVSLRELSDQTRIARRYLEAIEADDYKELPGGIFNRSFIKAYAKAVGFNETEAVNAYTEIARAHGEAPDELPTSRQSSRIYMDGDTSRSPVVTALLSLVILAIISLGIYAGLHYYQRRNAATTTDPSAANTPAQTNTPAPGTNDQTLPAQTPDASIAAAATNELNVKIKARGEEVWVRTRVDDKPKSEGNIAADQTREITLSQAERLVVEYSKSKAAALEVTLNGRPASVPSEARKGKTLVEMVITKDGYEQLLQQP